MSLLTIFGLIFLKMNPLLIISNLFLFIPFCIQNSLTDFDTQIIFLEKLFKKAAMNFEFGSGKSATAIEVGFLGDLFTNEVVIMPTSKKYSFYPTAFITLFYGRKY